MVKTVAIGAAAGLLLLALGGVIGRYTAPVRVEERERVVTKTVEVQAKQKEETSVQSATDHQRDETNWRYRYVKRPDGRVEVTASSERKSGAEKETRREEARKEIQIEYRDVEVAVEKVRIVETEKARWAVTAGAGLSTGLRTTYRGEVGRRMVGPLWVGIWADTTKTAGVSLRLEW